MTDPTLEEMILSGAVEVAGLDKNTGEFLYSFTTEAPKLVPQFYKRHLDFVHREIMFFWENGFIDLDDMMRSNPAISLTPKAFDEDALAGLSPERYEALAEIKKALKVL